MALDSGAPEGGHRDPHAESSTLGNVKPLGRYVLLQLPGWGAAAMVLYAIWRWVEIPLGVAVGLFALFVVKDVLLYPMSRRALLSPAQAGAEALVGRQGVAVDRLAPRGKVRLGAEVWMAESVSAQDVIPSGSSVQVDSVRGLTVRVRPVSPG